MELLSTRNISRYEDDGIRTLYECQACLYAATYVMDAYGIPEHITCPQCGYSERKAA